MTRILNQFPISHYCEKTRWHLDAKGLPYEVKNLLPGIHMAVNFRLVGKVSVPVLIDDGNAIGDSTDIALYIESRYPERALIPEDPAGRARVLDLEAFFDDTLGPAVRRWMYGQALETRGLVPKLFFRGYPTLGAGIQRVLGGPLTRQIRRMYRIDAAGIARSADRLEQAACRIEELVNGDPTRYLTEDRLTLADVTAASLFAPLVGPPGSPWSDLVEPVSVAAKRDEMRARVAGQWVLARYAADRGASAAI